MSATTALYLLFGIIVVLGFCVIILVVGGRR